MAKNTNKFQNLIKNYDLIREMIRHIYMYGNYSKGDIVKNNIIKSERSVYDMIKRIENYLGSKYLKTHNLPNRKKDKRGYRFKYDPFQCPINYLADTYQNCSYVIEDFIFYFTLLQSINPYKKYNSYKKHGLEDYFEDVSELTIDDSFGYDKLVSSIHEVLMANEDILQQIGQSSSEQIQDAEILITPAKARDRLNELIELGIIEKNNDNRYSLARDIFESFEIESLDELLLMVQFFYNFTELCIPGYYLATTINQYIISNSFNTSHSFHNEQTNPVFFYQNNNIQNVIDDDIFWFIICAIDQLKPITYKYKNKEGIVNNYEVFPMKIVVEKQYGRHYFYGYNYAYGNFIIQRLDSISSIGYSKMKNKVEIFCFLKNTKDNYKEQINKLYNKKMAHVWNIATSKKMTNVTIHFSFPDKKYDKLYNRLLSTGRDGIITKTGKNTFDYSILVQSQFEMKPWIRSFGAYATVDKVLNPLLFEDIKKDYRRALNSYGII